MVTAPEEGYRMSGTHPKKGNQISQRVQENGVQRQVWTISQLAKFFKPALDSHGLRGHSQKLFKPRCATTVRRTFFSSRVVNDWIGQLATTCYRCINSQYV